jgi:hypothetical protein
MSYKIRYKLVSKILQLFIFENPAKQWHETSRSCLKIWKPMQKNGSLWKNKGNPCWTLCRNEENCNNNWQQPPRLVSELDVGSNLWASSYQLPPHPTLTPAIGGGNAKSR